MNLNFWKNKKVFITGHTGFKGGWLTLWLHHLGAQVTGYSLPPSSNPSFFDCLNLKDLCHNIVGDVRDVQFLKKSLRESEAEIVFHLAAQPIVRRSYEDPVETYSTNVMGTVNLLEAVRNSSFVKSCVIVTSDKCYENQELKSPFTEEDKLGGHDPYSSSKACSELVTSAYIQSFFNAKADLGVASARAGNVIGGGDFAEDRLIPDFYRAIVNNKELRIRFPHSVRPWQHVLDSLSGYLKLAENLFQEPKKFSRPFNFGPLHKDAITVKEMIQMMINQWSPKLSVTYGEETSKHESNFLTLDSRKAATDLNWRPHWELRETIEQTALWYKAFLNREDIKEISINQIIEFEKSL